MQIHDAMRCLSLKPRTSFELMTFLLRTTKDQISYKNGAVIISDELWLPAAAWFSLLYATMFAGGPPNGSLPAARPGGGSGMYHSSII